ncbi:hypothetical protein CHU95_18905 [Niveispirillum lacus]|uniref:SPOR domain-containing protein n=1 Tax=Niveispirillum lacus TaxID=1981099 RepID=A0A255YUA9_9PROT|nr:SPOR domain-containing protein [Niveispirillum lacus]OYQ32817.1 hypothetical protein CHU95_18905 [Niveispirillum lacus]
MTYYDDEDDKGQNPPPAAGRPASRGDFRADPSFSPRAVSPPPHPPHPQAAPSPMDDYVQPQRPAAPPPLSAHPLPPVSPAETFIDPAAAGYRAPAQDPYADPAYQSGYAQGPAAQQAQDAYYQDYEQQHPGYYQAELPRRRNLLNIGVIAGAVIVFGGIIFYAYNQGMRAGTESVAPILRADTSPTKIRPEQPGGMEVPHQDKLVYDRLNPANSTPPGEVERLLPPPEAPMDRPRSDMAEPSEELPLAEEGEGAVAALRDAVPEESGYQPAPQPIPTYAPPVAAPVPNPAPVPLPPPQRSVQAPPVVAPPQPVPAPAIAPPPAATMAPKPAVTAPPAAGGSAKPTAGGASVRIQVAAVDAESKATAEWQRLQRKFAGELGGLSMRTVRVQLPKGIFYRIQGGPVDEARAKQICAAMTAQGAGCSIVR